MVITLLSHIDTGIEDCVELVDYKCAKACGCETYLIQIK